VGKEEKQRHQLLLLGLSCLVSQVHPCVEVEEV